MKNCNFIGFTYFVCNKPLIWIIIFERETLQENNTALEQERKLNVELLYSIFPADIAENLWLGKQVQAQTLSVS